MDARCGNRELVADEVLRDGFSDSLPSTPLVPLPHVVTSLEECAWDAHLVINGLPSTDTKDVFARLGNLWRERRGAMPAVISLSKGVEFKTLPHAHIITPATLISLKARVPMERVFYFGGPNIAAVTTARARMKASAIMIHCLVPTIQKKGKASATPASAPNM